MTDDRFNELDQEIKKFDKIGSERELTPEESDRLSQIFVEIAKYHKRLLFQIKVGIEL